jgi:hypothetical protein
VIRRAGPDPALRVQLGIRSPYVLATPDPTEEGVPVASYKDLCAGALHAICDRFEPRDIIDLHAILHRPGPDEDAGRDLVERRRRARDLVADPQRIDPGLTVPRIGEAVAQSRNQLRLHGVLLDVSRNHVLAQRVVQGVRHPTIDLKRIVDR